LTTNLISNTEFKSTSGWKGVAYFNSEGKFSGAKPSTENKPVVENIYGRFEKNKFISALEELNKGEFSAEAIYAPYMKLDFSQVEKTEG
jgi:hypothetical protein